MALLKCSPTLRSIGITDVLVGENVVVVEPVNLYGCSIGAETFIGPFVEIQRGASIGANCRIQSHVFICDMVTISDNCFISHGVKFVNDKFSTGGPARGDRSMYTPTHIGENVSIGTNATILPVSICDDVVIGAGSVLTKDVTIPGAYSGNPARMLPRSGFRSPDRTMKSGGE